MRPRESLFALAFMASWLACGGDDLVAPTPGEIVVTVSTSGEEPDADGYTVTLDGQLAATLEPNGTTSLTAPEGDHTVDLGGLAANCSVAAGVSRSVRVVAAQETPVAFDVVCVSTAGGLKVNIVTTGPQQDADGYAVQVDGGDPQAIDPNASVTLTALPAGNHVVGLLEVAENCVVSGDNPRSVAVVAGEIIEIVFELACIATLGGISISTSTTGSGTDEDGYTARVDEGPEQPIGLNGTLLVAEIAPGLRNISLGSVAPNCVVEGDNPRAVEVPAGDPVAVEFRVSCTSGVRQWTAMASNTDADLPDVWGSSASNVFVVGELPVDANGDVASVILHFDGTTWTPIFTETNLMLRAVWGSSETDVYAAGFDFAGDARMLRFDGTRWSDLPGFAAGSLEEISLASVWGSSASDIFAVGTTIDGVERRSLVFHYDGIGWQRMPVTSRVAPGLMDVWGSSPTDVYAVGRDAGARTGVIMHYDGTGWSPVLEQTDLLLNAVWGTADDDVYAGGFRVDEDFNVTGAILHFDGSDWSDVDLPPSDVINELWASSADDVFAVGAGGAVLHFDGAGWTKTNPTTTDLLGIWGLSASDVFAVGLMGTILRGTP